MFGCDTMRDMNGSRGGGEVGWADSDRAVASRGAANGARVQWSQNENRDLGQGGRILSANHHVGRERSFGWPGAPSPIGKRRSLSSR